MTYRKLSDFIYDCDTCPTRCDGKSKGSYVFENDLAFAEAQENIIIAKLRKLGRDAAKCTQDGYPDIVIREDDHIRSFVEVKAQRRTFMSVQRLLPQADLTPSETVALNLSDLQRYFGLYFEKRIPIFIIWVLQNRPCIVPAGESLYFYQTITALHELHKKYGNKRTFRRKSGRGDVVDGVHKGVVVNYHFSLKELKPLRFPH